MRTVFTELVLREVVRKLGLPHWIAEVTLQTSANWRLPRKLVKATVRKMKGNLKATVNSKGGHPKMD